MSDKDGGDDRDWPLPRGAKLGIFLLVLWTVYWVSTAVGAFAGLDGELWLAYLSAHRETCDVCTGIAIATMVAIDSFRDREETSA